MNQLILDSDYKLWLRELKLKIKESQIKAALSVNSQLILLYWDLGRQIVEKQENVKWGSGFIKQLSKDLKSAFPEITGFSIDNLRFMRRLFLFYNPQFSIAAQAVQQLKKGDKIITDMEIIKYAQPVQQFEEKESLNLIVSIP